jgi:hypothetical protein
MGYTYQGKAETASLSTADPVTLSCTLSSGDNLLVVAILGASNGARTGGTPQYNGSNMTQAETEVLGYKECSCEIWYHLSPDTGAPYNISVPNSGGKSIRLNACWFTTASTPTYSKGGTDNAGGSTSTTGSVTLTSLTAGDAVVSAFGGGHKDIISANSDNLLYSHDEGAWNSASQYEIAAGGDTTHTFTQGDDDVAMVAAAWTESAAAIGIDGASAVALSTTGVLDVTRGVASQSNVAVTVNGSLEVAREIAGASALAISTTAALSVTRSIKSTYLPTGRMIYFKLDDNRADTLLVDEADPFSDGVLGGGDNTATLNTTGKVDDALNFNGTDDYGDTGKNLQSTFKKSFSVAAWFNSDDGQQSILNNWYAVLDNSGADIIEFGHSGGTSPGAILFMYKAGGNQARAWTNNNYLPNGVTGWHSIIGTADDTIGGVGGVKLFFDGAEILSADLQEEGNTSAVTFTDWASTENPYIGAKNDEGSSTQFHDGSIDEIVVFDHALSAAEIAILANPPASGPGGPKLSIGVTGDLTVSGQVSLQGQSDISLSTTANLGRTASLRSCYIPRGRALHYRLEDDANTPFVTDEEGNYNGSVVNDQNNYSSEQNTSAGKNDDAFQLDGSNDYIDVGNTLQSILRGSFAIGFWANFDDGNPPANRLLLGVRDSGYNNQLYVWLQATGEINVAYKAGGNAGNNLITTSSPIPNGPTGLYHIVCVFDSTVGGVGGKKCYINSVLQSYGASDGSTAGVTFSDYTSSNNVFIGTSNEDGSPYGTGFDGIIDEFVIFDRVLSASEVADLYNYTPSTGTGGPKIKVSATADLTITTSIAGQSDVNISTTAALSVASSLAGQSDLSISTVTNLGGTFAVAAQSDIAISTIAALANIIEIAGQSDISLRVGGDGFQGDTACKALYQFESGGLTTDSKGSNTLTASGSPTVNTSDYQESFASCDFERSTPDYFYVANGSLDAGFPYKGGESTEVISICAWLKIETLANELYVVGKMTGPGANVSLGVRVNATGELSVMLYGSGWEVLDYGSTLSAGIWYHIGVTYDSSSKNYRIRVWDDNAKALLDSDATGISTQVPVATTTHFAVANAYGFADRTFDGLLDEVVVFNDILTASEIDLIRQGKFSGTFLSVQRDVVGQSDVTISTTGATDVARELAGQSDVAITTTSDLSITGAVTLQGQSDISIGTTAALSVATALAGQSDVALTTTGLLDAGQGLAGQSNVTISTTSDLTVQEGTVDIQGQSDVAISSAGAIDVTRELVGQSDIALATTAALDAGQGLISQSDIALSTTAALDTGQGLAGQSDVTIATAGALDAGSGLVGQSDVQISVTGSLSVTMSLVGQSDVVISTTSDLSVVGEVALQGQSDISLAASGDLTVAYALAGQSDVTLTTTSVLDILIPWDRASSYVITVGTLDGGTLDDTYAIGGGSLVLGETGSNPAFQFDFTFGEEISVPTSDLVVHITGYYDGNPAHIVKLQQWDYNLAQWDNVTAAARDFPADSSDQTYSFALINDADHIQAGQIQLRFHHPVGGNPLHAFHFDFVGLTAVALAAQSDVTTSTTGLIEAQLALAAQSDVVISTTAAMTVVGEVVLQGQSDVSITAQGTLSVARAVAGAADIVISTSAVGQVVRGLESTSGVLISTTSDLTVVAAAVDLQGQSDLTISTSGSLSVTREIAGLAQIALSAAGAVGLDIPLLGQVAVNLAVSGLLGLQKQLSGAADIQISASGAISIVLRLSGQSDIAISASGTTQLAIGLVGSSDVVMNVVGRAVVAWSLAATSHVQVGNTALLFTQIRPAWMAPANYTATNAFMSRT